MYYPLQIPSILDKQFMEHLEYKEYKDPILEDYIMCIWSMKSYKCLKTTLNNIILPDGCIDLIVDFSNNEINFTASSKASLHFPLNGNVDFMGIRIRTGIFYNIFHFNCINVMDKMIPYMDIEKDYNLNGILELDTYKERVSFLLTYFKKLVAVPVIDDFVKKINSTELMDDIKYAGELANYFGYSERQMNRIFKERCGVSVKVFLNIIRLHRALNLLVTNQSNKMIDLAMQSGFYDESHFIRSIKKYCGISPTELIERYKMS